MGVLGPEVWAVRTGVRMTAYACGPTGAARSPDGPGKSSWLLRAGPGPTGARPVGFSAVPLGPAGGSVAVRGRGVVYERCGGWALAARHSRRGPHQAPVRDAGGV